MKITNYTTDYEQQPRAAISGFAGEVKPSYNDVGRRYAHIVSDLLQYNVNADLFSKVYRTDAETTEYFSLAGWKSRCRDTREIVVTAKEEAERRKAILATIYAGDALAQQRKNIDESVYSLVDTARKLIQADFDAVMLEKQMQHDAALNAPSDETVRLLTVLSMRDDVTQDEIGAVVDRVGGNLQALRALANIASKKNLYFPKLPTETDYHEAVERMTELCRIAVDDCNVSTDALGYGGRIFWTTDEWSMNTNVSEAARQLDAPVYMEVLKGAPVKAEEK